MEMVFDVRELFLAGGCVEKGEEEEKSEGQSSENKAINQNGTFSCFEQVCAVMPASAPAWPRP